MPNRGYCSTHSGLKLPKHSYCFTHSGLNLSKHDYCSTYAGLSLPNHTYCSTHSGLCREHFHFYSAPLTWPTAAFCQRNSSSCSSCRSMKLPTSVYADTTYKLTDHNRQYLMNVCWKFYELFGTTALRDILVKSAI